MASALAVATVSLPAILAVMMASCQSEDEPERLRDGTSLVDAAHRDSMLDEPTDGLRRDRSEEDAEQQGEPEQSRHTLEPPRPHRSQPLTSP